MSPKAQKKITVGGTDYTEEDVANLIAEAQKAEDEIERLRTLCFNAHREAATWVAAASKLLKIVGSDRLKEVGFKTPDTAYMARFNRLIQHLAEPQASQDEASTTSSPAPYDSPAA